MEKEKNKNGLIAALITIIIILLALVILFTTGTISLKTEENTIKEEEKAANTENTNTDLISKLVGTYSYKGKYVDSTEDIGENFDIKDTIYDELVLNSSGEAEAKAGSVRAGGYTAKGKWYISKDEIIILNEECTPTSIDNNVEYINCSPKWIYKYKIENDTITVTSINNTMESMVLEKIK